MIPKNYRQILHLLTVPWTEMLLGKKMGVLLLVHVNHTQMAKDGSNSLPTWWFSSWEWVTRFYICKNLLGHLKNSAIQPPEEGGAPHA